MAVIEQAVFVLLLWGAIFSVFGVFCHEVLVVGRDAGWFE